MNYELWIMSVASVSIFHNQYTVSSFCAHFLVFLIDGEKKSFLEILDNLEILGFYFSFFPFLYLNTPERRCSSRTFRYGYLVTT